jgi:hypothetical protein
MRAFQVILILAVCGAVVSADDVSDDGWLTGIRSTEPGHIEFATDEVPLPTSPDYQIELRMQVGGLSFGDFDNDGDLDLAAGCYHSQSFPPYDDWRNFVLVNNNGRLEDTPSWWSTDERSTTDIKWADFDSNGYLDLFAANGDFSFDENVIYFGTVDGLSNSPGWLASDQTWTTGCAAADFDNDGDIDMATSNQGVTPNPTRPVYIYINGGSGLETTPSWQTSDLAISSFISWGDMDNDGWPDLSVSKWVNYESCVYRNNEGIIGASPHWGSGSTRSDKGIGWGDVDNDSFPELAIGGTEPTWLFENIAGDLGTSPVWQSNNSYHGCQDLAWADIDHDGDPDLATVEFSTGNLRIYLNIEGALETTPSWVYDGNGSGTALAFGDIDGDGLTDLAMGQSGQPCVLIFLNNIEIDKIDEPDMPADFSLAQNYPNPFNAGTTIGFEIRISNHVRLEIYDISGRRVDKPIDRLLAAGNYILTWNAAGMPSGSYYYRLSAGGKIFTRKMILVK